MKKNLIIGFALALATTAFAEVPADTQLTLGEVDLPVYIHTVGGDSRFVQPTVVYPISTVVRRRRPMRP